MSKDSNREKVDWLVYLRSEIYPYIDGYYHDDEYVSGHCEEMAKKIHQELQKARADWLREEIVKLEGMRRDQGGSPHKVYSKEDTIFNSALRTIIDRYLQQLKDITKE